MTRRHSIPDRLVQVFSTRSSATSSHLTTSKDGRSAYDKNNCINLRALASIVASQNCFEKTLPSGKAFMGIIWRKRMIILTAGMFYDLLYND